MTSWLSTLFSFKFLSALALAVPLLAIAEYPDKPIKLIVPFPPGAGTDATARLIANALSTQMKQTIVVENRAGAGGAMGAQTVVDSVPDGYTLFFATTGTLAFNQHLYAKLRYNPLTDFSPIAGVASFPNVLVIHPSVPAKSVTEFVAFAKSKPGQMTYASSGTGSSSHLAVVLFESMTGTSFTHVPYKGTSPALADLLSGRVDFMIDNITTHSALAKQGRTRALGVSGLTPSQMLPGLATISAAGVPGYDMSLWYAILGPNGMPAERVSKLSDDLRVVMSQPKMRQALEAIGNEPMFLAPKELGNFIKSESLRWGEIVRKSGVKPQ